jgi:transposase
MAKRKRRAFATEFKAQAVRIVRESGKSVGVVARELDLDGDGATELGAAGGDRRRPWGAGGAHHRGAGGARSKTRRSSNRAATLLRIAAVNIGRTETALGAFYRRLAARIGKAKAVTATARKLATLFYTALRFGLAYADPGAS